MIAKRLTLDESAQYDDLSESDFARLRANPEQLDLTNPESLRYHTSKAEHDETTHVKIRLLYSHSLPVNF